MQTLQLDVWRTDETAELRLTLAHTDNTEHTIVLSEANGYPKPVVGQWTHLDVPLSEFTGLSSVSAIDQITLSSHSGSANSGETLYLDNLFTSKPPPQFEVTFDSGSYALADGFVLDTEAGFQLSDVTGGSAGAIPSFFAPPGGSGNVVRFLKNAGQGEISASIIDLDSTEIVDPSVSQITARVYTQSNNMTVRLKLEDVLGGDSVELSAVTAGEKSGQWQTVSWDASVIGNHSPNYDKALMYFEAVDASTAETHFVDDVQFY